MSTAELTTFTTPPSLGVFNVRVVQIDDEPWFVAADACRVLGMDLSKGTSQWLIHLRSDERRLIARDGTPEFISGVVNGTSITVINEFGLYRLILRSDKPEARAFQDWVTREVLPSIRKNGIYVQGQELVKTGEITLAELGRQAADAYRRLSEALQQDVDKLAAENAVLAPKAAIVDQHVAPRTYDTVGRFARTLDGVNTIKVKQDLTREGYLWRTKAGAYRVRAGFRDRLFVEKLNPAYGNLDIYVTPAGREEMVSLYQGGRLTQKRGHTTTHQTETNGTLTAQ